MFINVSNHPSANWNKEQYRAASQDGQVIDLLFPEIDPYAGREEIIELAQKYYSQISKITQLQDLPTSDVTVMVSGEFTFTYHLVEQLLKVGYHVVSACTKRDASEKIASDGSVIKTAKFVFVQFRAY